MSKIKNYSIFSKKLIKIDRLIFNETKLKFDATTLKCLLNFDLYLTNFFSKYKSQFMTN